jgi:DNA-directed RNA polymerase specialized sigma24 family protein
MERFEDFIVTLRERVTIGTSAKAVWEFILTHAWLDACLRQHAGREQRRWGLGADMVDDMVQSVKLLMLTRLSHRPGLGCDLGRNLFSLLAWWNLVLRRLVLDVLRREVGPRRRPRPIDPELLDEQWAAPPPRCPEAADIVEWINKEAEPARTVLALRLQGYKFDEVAGMTGRSRSAVHGIYKEAVGRLRKAHGQDGPAPAGAP